MASSANIVLKRDDSPYCGRMRFTTRSLYVPSAPRFLARNTSAIPPTPRRRMTSNSARRFGMRVDSSVIDGSGTRPIRRGAFGNFKGRILPRFRPNVEQGRRLTPTGGFLAGFRPVAGETVEDGTRGRLLGGLSAVARAAFFPCLRPRGIAIDGQILPGGTIRRYRCGECRTNRTTTGTPTGLPSS